MCIRDSTYTTASLHAAIVEIFALDGAYMRYSTIQNWSDNVYNLVTKRATAKKNATVEWIDGNLGAEVTMKYPSVYLDGEGARGTMLSIAFANAGQDVYKRQVLWIAAITNAINLIDGLDGLVGGVSIISLMTMGVISYFFLYDTDIFLNLTIFVLVAAIIGFFPYNYHPAIIYLGDTCLLYTSRCV